MRREAREEGGKPASFGNERTKCPNADDSMGVVPEQVGTGRIQIGSFDQTNGKVVTKMIPNSPLPHGKQTCLIQVGVVIVRDLRLHANLLPVMFFSVN